jgi:alginate O-acetyltransferase complex protein AlgI
MKDYLYIPLGGNKVSKVRLLLNLWIVFLVSGLWHGASWTFVIWGAYHGFLLILDRLFLSKLSERIFKPISMLLTFLLVMIGWVFFRANTIEFAGDYIHRMFSFTSSTVAQPLFELRFRVMFYLAIILSFYPASIGLLTDKIKLAERIPALALIFKGGVLLMLLIICIANINGSDFNPFIYFRF